MNNFLSSIWNETTALLHRHWKVYLWMIVIWVGALPLLTYLLDILTSGIVNSTLYYGVVGLLSILLFALSIAFWSGFLRVLNTDNLKKYHLLTFLEKGGGDMWKVLISFFITGILMYLCLIVGMLFLFLPAIYLMVVFQFFAYLIVLEKKYWFSSFPASFRFIKNRWWKTFAATAIIILSAAAVWSVIVQISGGWAVVSPSIEVQKELTILNMLYWVHVNQPLYVLALNLTMPFFYFAHLALYRVLKKERG